MTTRWQVPKDMWLGETVAVLAPGPSLTHDLADSVREHRCIAVRRAFQLAPWADMMVSLDGPTGSKDDAFWEDAKGFSGMRVCGTECEIDALYPGLMYERVEIGPAHIVSIRNNGLAAIRIAGQTGAQKILLLGFDPEAYEARESAIGFRGLTEGLAAIIAAFRAQGIEIESKE